MPWINFCEAGNLLPDNINTLLWVGIFATMHRAPFIIEHKKHSFKSLMQADCSHSGKCDPQHEAPRRQWPFS